MVVIHSTPTMCAMVNDLVYTSNSPASTDKGTTTTLFGVLCLVDCNPGQSSES